MYSACKSQGTDRIITARSIDCFHVVGETCHDVPRISLVRGKEAEE